MKYWILLFSLVVFSTAAEAKWYEAQSDNFVIYADDSEKDVRRFAEMLEQYHASMEFITGRKLDKPSPSNRVTIFAVGSKRDIRKLSGSKSTTIAGFYIPRAGGSKAFVQDIRLKSGYPDFSTVVLLHEYAHHFLISSSRYAMPRWMSEGAAEFFAAATFNRDGSVLIGRPAQHRAGELAYAKDVSIYELLDRDLYEKNKGRKYDSFYGRSWLLYHYLQFEPTRKGQLTAYWKRVVEGETSTDAAQEAFGDLDQLGKDLDRYLKQRRMMTFNLKPDWLTVGEVSIRELSEGEADIMPLRMRSQRGVTREEALELLPDVQKVAKQYPNDPAVLTVLAEAEVDAGNNAAAIAAANAAIALDPKQRNAYVQKGYALFREAIDAEDPDSAYKAAMAPFSALNALENDHPLPLIYYYRSFVARGKEPPEQARHALERAAELAPFDHGLWVNVGAMQAAEGKIALAKESLSPVAANPHGGRTAVRAEALIAALQNATEGEPFRARSRPKFKVTRQEGREE